MQCYIKRIRSGLQKLWPYYVLYSQDPDKFLLSGRRRKKNKQSTYLISSDEKVSSQFRVEGLGRAVGVGTSPPSVSSLLL